MKAGFAPRAAVAQEWTRQLGEEGAVRFGRSWGKAASPVFLLLAFMPVGVAGILAADRNTFSMAVAAFFLAVFGFHLVRMVMQIAAAGPALMVDRRGMTLGYRPPLTIRWEQVNRVYTEKGMTAHMVAVDVFDESLLDEFARRVPPWVREPLGLSRLGAPPNTMMIGPLTAPAGRLATWLDAQVDVNAAVPSELILNPLEESSPVLGELSCRPVEVSRLEISRALCEALTDWGRRAAPSCRRFWDGDEPGAAWPSLVEEGDRLAEHLRRELGDRAVVHWFGHLLDKGQICLTDRVRDVEHLDSS